MLNDNLFKTEKVLSLLPRAKPEIIRRVVMPIYNIAGDQDPVGEYGVGVYQVSNWLIQTGHTVTTKLYSGYRHEIHNYAEIKNEVEAGIIAFMDGILS